MGEVFETEIREGTCPESSQNAKVTSQSDAPAKGREES